MKLDGSKMNFGSALALRNTAIAPKESKLTKLTGLYDEQQKLVFLFDISGSMGMAVAKSYTDLYIWTPEKLAEIRAALAKSFASYNAQITNPLAAMMTGVGLTYEEQRMLQTADPQHGPNGELSLTCSDEDLEIRVVRCNLIDVFNVPVNWVKHNEKPLTRIELTKKLAKQEIANRFAKHPGASVAVIAFGSQSAVMGDGVDGDALLKKLEALDLNYRDENGYAIGGGTDIMKALKTGVEVCRKNPSSVGVHHFVVVTDGEDGNADMNIGSWVPALKASGVVLDYIHIGDETPNPLIKAACEALGGECVVVNTERDFESKFIAAVNRLMLPAGN